MRAPTDSLAAIALAPIALVPILVAASPAEEPGRDRAPILSASTAKVGRFERIELAIAWTKEYANPFDPDEVDVALEVQAPGGTSFTVPAFWDQPHERRRIEAGGRTTDWLYPAGAPGWKARFAPVEVGPHAAIARVRDAAGETVSEPFSFECVPSDRKGYVRVSPVDPRFFSLSTGEPFFAIGQNLAFIGEGQHVTPSRAEEIFRKLSENGANWLRIWTCCEDWALAIEARKSAWGRSWAWDPPFAPAPGAAAPGRRSIRLARPGRAAVDVSPSRRVAVRPATRYRIEGRVLLEGAAELWLDLGSPSGAPIAARGSARDWTGFSRGFETGPDQLWLGAPRLRLEGEGAASLDALSLKEAAGGPELLQEADPNRAVPGTYDLLDAAILDRVVEAAEGNGIRLQVCALTRDLYMPSLADPASPEYRRATDAAKKVLRYYVARWGCSTSVATWEYFNEMDPGRPTGPFYDALGEHLARIDPWRHLRGTSAWAPAPDDWKRPSLDVADLHFYVRPEDEKRHANEVEALLDRARFLRRGAPGKPALLAEFGLADAKWGLRPEMAEDRDLIHFHGALWASALSGLSGTAMSWWWEQLDRMQAYGRYRPLAAYLAEIPFGAVRLDPIDASLEPSDLRVVGLRGEGRAHAWVQDPRSTWLGTGRRGAAAEEVSGASLEVRGLEAGSWRIRWWDTRAGTVMREASGTTGAGGSLSLEVPAFLRDVACTVLREP